MTSLNQSAAIDFSTQYGLHLSEDDDAIIVDLFAGGGGASTGLEQGLGRQVAIAINHNPAAISMHTANHPHAEHYQTDVWGVDPLESTGGNVVGWLHASPDCRHFSQAVGGQPRKKEIRDLSWVVKKWAGKLRRQGKGPWVISLENVKQILQWGRLIAKRDRDTGRVVKLDGSIAAVGERVPRHEQFLVPDPQDKGRIWRRFVRELEGLGYHVQWWIERNCDYGDPTTRQRLYLIATAEGLEPVRPVESHAKKPGKGQKAYRTAADCIDWSDLGTSIRNRKRPLAEATNRRIALGIKKEVIERAQPFIVPIANWSTETVHAVDKPLNTITAWPKGGHFALAMPHLVKFRFDAAGLPVDQPMPTITSGGDYKRPAGAAHALGLASASLIQVGYGERDGQAPRVPGLDKPLGTVVAGGGKHALATAFLAQANGGYNTMHSRPADAPVSTITNRGSQQQLVAANLVQLRANCDSRPADEPLRTLSAGGQHHGLVAADLLSGTLTEEQLEGALWCSAFLMRYHSTGGQWAACDSPLTTITTKDRLALVTVWISGDPYVIVDIRLRMLKPRELYRAQGFPDSYIIEHGHDGRRFSQSDQVHMCGNSVSPGTMAAFARANDPWRRRRERKTAGHEAKALQP
ncbi:DNA cytosine methyltransferase [Ectopseudomonas toyotomiensis]|uniref:DNA (cytosine-5-)-methyltransferase n=1 Tax=Ectopseudomonas toyotomiensis TaxID=554344 RepID=A0A1I5QZJ5_9GAMM|nr:DNA cytosine methyltransferase [Pseudomonas toyotomiensis]PIA74267.1 DNA cytosine methyltransferase [Pseudomonas toyotomiensis]SFP51550.1 DNA (cytosine-5)-methyltransferase 1 [Pseudomonas toyotomiensis]